MDIKKTLYIDKRATGQGKTYDMINFILNTDKRCLLLSSNVSNIDDFVNDTIKVINVLPNSHNRRQELLKFIINIKENKEKDIENFKLYIDDLEENINNIKLLIEEINTIQLEINKNTLTEEELKYYKDKLNILVENSKSINSFIKDKEVQLKELNKEKDKQFLHLVSFSKQLNIITEYLKDDSKEDVYIEALKMNFIKQIIPCVNSFFNVSKTMIKNGKKGQYWFKYPPKVKIFYGNVTEWNTYGKINGNSVDTHCNFNTYSGKSTERGYLKLSYPTESLSNQTEHGINENNINKYDYIFIDEADKTIGGLTLKSSDDRKTYLSVNIKELKEDYELNKNLYHSFYYPMYSILDDLNISKQYPCNIIEFDGNLLKYEKIKSFLNSRSIVFDDCINNTIEYTHSYLESLENCWNTFNPLNVTKHKEFNLGKDVEYLFITTDKVIEFLHNHLTDEGVLTILGATRNSIIDNFLNNDYFNNKGKPPFLSEKPYHTPITYHFHKTLNQQEVLYNGNYFIVGKNQVTSKELYKQKIKNKWKAKIHYFTSPVLRGSNSLGGLDGVYLRFSLNDIKHGPTQSILSYFSKIGNQYIRTEKDLKKVQSSYNAFTEEFNRFKVNNIIQIIGRLNRGNPIKHIYYTDDEVGKIVRDYIVNVLKQEVIYND